jgi:hypothetical protein
MEMPARSRPIRKKNARTTKQAEGGGGHAEDEQTCLKPPASIGSGVLTGDTTPVFTEQLENQICRSYSGDESTRPGNQKIEPRDAVRPIGRRRSTERARHLNAGVGSAATGSAGITLLFSFHATSKALHPTVTRTGKAEQTNR